MSLNDLPAIEIAGLNVGLREIVLLLIFCVAVYIAIVLYRMRRIQELASLAPTTLDNPQTDASSRTTLAGEAMPTETQRASYEVSDVQHQRHDGSSEASTHPQDEAMARELAQLRDEVDALRGALAALREEMQEEFGHLRATQSVSPVYGDAMQLAVAGYDPAMIAERCGIARAEAELVVALARSQVK